MSLLKKLFGDPLKEAQEAKQARGLKAPVRPQPNLGSRPAQGTNRDEELSREFVRQVFDAGRETCRYVAEGVRMTTDGRFAFPINNNVSAEISMAILGTALAILKGNSQIMTAERGNQIEVFCRRSIRRDYGMPSEDADWIDHALDEYQAAFRSAITGNKNPFGETFGRMLVRCLGASVSALCISGTSALNPAVHETVGNLATLTVKQVLEFWKGK